MLHFTCSHLPYDLKICYTPVRVLYLQKHCRTQPNFGRHIFKATFQFGVAQMFMDLVLEGLLREHLMVAPLLVVVGITEQLVTMGAEDFKVTWCSIIVTYTW